MGEIHDVQAKHEVDALLSRALIGMDLHAACRAHVAIRTRRHVSGAESPLPAVAQLPLDNRDADAPHQVVSMVGLCPALGIDGRIMDAAVVADPDQSTSGEDALGDEQGMTSPMPVWRLHSL
jgi:hypothetical protein